MMPVPGQDPRAGIVLYLLTQKSTESTERKGDELESFEQYAKRAGDSFARVFLSARSLYGQSLGKKRIVFFGASKETLELFRRETVRSLHEGDLGDLEIELNESSSVAASNGNYLVDVGCFVYLYEKRRLEGENVRF
jgi:hypothetical protein